jgi:hypothetical protein
MNLSLRGRCRQAARAQLHQINFLDPDLWDRIPENAQRELLRQSEIMVKGTVTVALGADLRAATIMSVFGAGGVALLAAAATLIGEDKPAWQLIWAPVVGASGLFIAAIFCALAIKPVNFLLPGARPQSMLRTNVEDEQCLRATLIHSAERAIGHNMATMMRSAEWFNRALLIAGGGVLAGMGLIIALWADHHPF